MKIGDITQKDVVQKNLDSTRDKRIGSSDDFKTMFQGELSSLTGEMSAPQEATANAMALEGPMDLSTLWRADRSWNDMQSTADAARAVGEKLDRIGQLVGEEGIDLKRIDETLGALSREAGNLQTTVKDLPEDHPLRRVSDELNVLAYVESVKWRRGDYV